MTTSLLVLFSAFIVVLAVELPDKTLVATLMLTTRYRAWPVFVGVSVAFMVQCVIAVSFGSVLTLLPDQLVSGAVAVLFGIGAVMLLREGFSKDDSDDDAAGKAGTGDVAFRRAALTSFGVLFAAEWGDASQLATVGLTAHYGAPFAVGLGAWLALVAIGGIAVLIGRKIQAKVKPQLVQRIAGALFALFALFAVYHTVAA